MAGIPEHLKSMVARVRNAPIEEPPLPWQKKGIFAVGGLTDIGFGRQSDLLLVISSTGRGVFDCLSGERVARDPSMPADNESNWRDCSHLEAQGIGPLAGQIIHTAGLCGGGLPVLARDGWQVERLVLNWPEECLLLVPPGSWIYGENYGKPATFTKIAADLEVRAWGFSPTGRSLVQATSSDLTVFCRDF